MYLINHLTDIAPYIYVKSKNVLYSNYALFPVSQEYETPLYIGRKNDLVKIRKCIILI